MLRVAQLLQKGRECIEDEVSVRPIEVRTDKTAQRMRTLSRLVRTIRLWADELNINRKTGSKSLIEDLAMM